MTPLAGIKVLDLSQVIAGPYGAALLTTSGAEVIKIEPPNGELWRDAAATFLAMNRGKRSLPLNLRSEEGLQLFYRLVARSDVLVENYRAGVTERLKIDYATLAAINPRLVYFSITAFGPEGPYAHRPGFDPLLQALTGIERAQGGEGNPPVFLRIAITDFTTGLLQAAAVTLALFNRERTGRGAHINASLLRTGLYVNGSAFSRYAGHPGRVLPDAGQHGYGPLDRIYATSDGWLFLRVGEDEDLWRRLISMPPLASLAGDERFRTAAGRMKHADALAGALEAVFKTDATEAWLAALETARVPAAPVIVEYEKRFFEDVQPIINQYAVRGPHARLGRVEHPGNFIHFSAASTAPEGPSTPLLGQHTDAILKELGLREDDIAGLRDRGVTR